MTFDFVSGQGIKEVIWDGWNVEVWIRTLRVCADGILVGNRHFIENVKSLLLAYEMDGG
jgi:hypothetical protein